MFTPTDLIVAVCTGLAVGIAMGVFIGWSFTWLRMQARIDRGHERVKRVWSLAGGVKTW